MSDRTIFNNVNVQYFKYYDDDNLPNVHHLAYVSLYDAKRIMRLIRDAHKHPNFEDRCIDSLSMRYIEPVRLVPYPEDIADLEPTPTLEIRDFSGIHKKCGLNNYGARPKCLKCFKHMAAGKCTDPIMQKIAQILYPEKYGNQR